MKRFLTVLLFMILSFSVVFVACSVVDIDPHVHEYDTNWSYNEEFHYHACAGCDETADKAAHGGGTATCRQRAVCSVCGAEYGELAAHIPGENYVTDEINHRKVCSVCGETIEGTFSAHAGGFATCKQKAVCDVCGEEYGEIGKHKFSSNGVCEYCDGTLNLIYTEASPYDAKSAEDLVYIGKLLINDADLSGCYFKQSKDIDLSGIENFKPIGTIGIPFGGVFDGNGYEITGLNISTDESYLGLFGFVTGMVKNVTISGNIRGINDGENNVGYAHTFAGGIAGAINNGAVIDNCVNYVNVTGDAFVGGIVGEIMETDYLLFGIEFATVKNCKNYGKITAYAKTAVNEKAMYFGGIAGRNNGYIFDSVNYGEVDGDTYSADSEKGDSCVGGITGYSYIPFKNGAGPNELMDYIAISGCTNYGYVHGSYAVGGILGQGVFSLSDCRNEGKVLSYNCVGGIVGIAGTKATLSFAAGTIENCVNNGEVLSTERNAGGIVGYNYVAIKNCESTVNAFVGADEGKRSYYTAGIAGTNEGGTIISCKNYSHIKASASSATVNGGIVGQLLGGTVSDCRNYGLVEGLNSSGGIFGKDSADHTAATVTGSYNYGEVKGTAFTGGIGGACYLAVIENCVNDGIVSGSGDVGGIIGWLSGSSHTVKNVTSDKNSSVTGTGNYVGGIIGRVGSNNAVNVCTLVNCVNKGSVSGVNDAGGILGGISAAPKTTDSNNLVIVDSINDGAVTGTGYTGGIVGIIPPSTDGKIENSVNGGSVSASDYRIGGIAGSIEPPRKVGGFTIDLCVNNGKITSVKGAYAGGIVGMHGSSVYVRGCSNTGDVTGVGTGSCGTGGISGSTFTNSVITSYEKSDGTIVKTTVSGTITGKKGFVNAIVGKNTKNTTAEADSTATVVEL